MFRKHIGDHWFDLGVELLDDRDVGELDTIKQNFPHNTKKCCTEMFQLWLSRCVSASWEDLIYALHAIELYHVADRVSQFYGMNSVCVIFPIKFVHFKNHIKNVLYGIYVCMFVYVSTYIHRS